MMNRLISLIAMLLIAASSHLAAQSGNPIAHHETERESFRLWQANNDSTIIAQAVADYNVASKRLFYSDAVKALERLCAYYTCSFNRPELIAWSDKLNSIPLRKEYEHSIFNIYRMLGALYVQNGEVDATVRIARKTRDDATSLNSSYGMAIYYQIYSFALLKAGQNASALDALAKALQIVQDTGNMPYEEFAIYLQILDIHILSGNLDIAGKVLPQLAETFENNKKQFPGSIKFRCEQIIDASYLYYYSETGNMDMANKYYMHIAPHDAIKIDHQMVFYRDRAMWAYYVGNKNYDNALEYIDYIIDENSYLMAYALRQKGDLLMEMGRYDEACETLRLAYRSMAASYSNNFGQELNEITLQQMQDDSLKREQELEIEKTRKTNMIIVTCLAAILILLIVTLLLTWKSSKLNRELKKSVARLETEHNDLVRRQFIIRESLDTTSNNAKARAIFLNNMSHEIRTPLNSIQGFGNLILQIADNKNQQEYASIICENSDYLLGLINNILDLGRLDAEKMKFEFGDYNLIEIITEASMLSKRSPEVDFVMKCDTDTMMVHTDRARAIKVLANVFDNAYKYTHIGSVTAEVNRNGNHVMVKIKDTGKGIPIEKSELIFERFEKLNPFDPGTGLGLSIARGIVERLGGSMKVDTSYRLGLCMVIDLPIGIEENQSIDSTASTAESGESQTTV